MELDLCPICKSEGQLIMEKHYPINIDGIQIVEVRACTNPKCRLLDWSFA